MIEEISKKDKSRRKLVKEMIRDKLLRGAADFYHAAMIFQHGNTPAYYKKANDLAKKALKIGESKKDLYFESAKWVYVATLGVRVILTRMMI